LRSDTSRGSVGSVGSVASVSSVISASAKSTFTMTSEHDRNRHKSKFNTISKGKKKKAKKISKKKMRPGSEEELQGLVAVLKSSVVEKTYCAILVETISYLSQIGQLSIARDLYQGYLKLSDKILESQSTRIQKAKVEKSLPESVSGTAAIMENLKLPCEADVDALRCATMPQELNDMFCYL